MVDPKRLAAADVTLDQVQEAVSDSLDVGMLALCPRRAYRTGGFVKHLINAFNFASAAAGLTPETLARVPVTRPVGSRRYC